MQESFIGGDFYRYNVNAGRQQAVSPAPEIPGFVPLTDSPLAVDIQQSSATPSKEDPTRADKAEAIAAIKYRISSEGITIKHDGNSILLPCNTPECQKLLEIRYNWRMSQQLRIRMQAAKRVGWGDNEDFAKANLNNISRHRGDFQKALRKILSLP